jgi:heat shock protein beta
MAMSIMGGIGFGSSMDLDNDGIVNMEDADDDGDGFNDSVDEYPHDHDNDGIPDCKDDDDDNDGINDTEDDDYVGNCSKPKRRMREPHDLDSDGIADCEDPDDDGDGINDTLDDYPHDHDNDGIPDFKDNDDDNDGINDTEDDQYVGNCTKRMRRFHKGHKRPGGIRDRGFEGFRNRVQDCDGCNDPESLDRDSENQPDREEKSKRPKDRESDRRMRK